MAGKAKSNGEGTKEDGSDAVRKDKGAGRVRRTKGESSAAGSGSGGKKEATGRNKDGGSGSKGSGGSGGRRLLQGSTAVAEKPPAADPLVDTPPQPKRRTGRKSKALLAQEEVEAQTLKRKQWEAAADTLGPMLQPLFVTVFDIIAKRRGEHWKLRSEETKQLARCSAIVLEKRLPSFWIEWQEEIVLALVLGGAVASRTNIDAKIVAERKLKGKAPEEDVSSSHNGNEAHRQDDIASALTPSLST